MIWKLFSNFLDRIKNGQDVDIPVYSHEVYDIVPEEKQSVKAADFVIVEGINVFQIHKTSVSTLLTSLTFPSMLMLQLMTSRVGIWTVS